MFLMMGLNNQNDKEVTTYSWNNMKKNTATDMASDMQSHTHMFSVLCKPKLVKLLEINSG